MEPNQKPPLEELDTTMSFVLKVRHKAWIKAQTAEARRAGDKPASDSKTVRDLIDAAMAGEEARVSA